MYQFIESICCQDGDVLNLDAHQQRVDSTFSKFFKAPSFRLKNLLFNVPASGKHKCRIIYDEEVQSIEFDKYEKKEISSLKFVEADDLIYDFKKKDRSKLTSLYEQRGAADDIIVVKNGLCTDSYFANLALFDGEKWLTPKSPLLKGTKRQKLLDEGRLEERDIMKSEIGKITKVSLINAMLDLGEVEILTNRVV